MNNWSKIKKVLSLFTFLRYQKIVSNSQHSSVFLKIYRWWDEQLTVSGKPILTLWLLICLPATFQLGKPAFYICLVLGFFNFTNYMIAYFLIHLKVNVIRNHSLSTHAGGVLSGTIEITNIGITNLKDIEVFERELPFGFTQPEIPYIPDINKNVTIKIPFTIHTQYRGEYSLKSIVVATSYPFGILRKIKVKKLPQDVIVYPQLLPLQLLKLKPGKSNVNNQQTKFYDQEQNEYVGNREYSFGDQFSAIDHKAWGRTGFPVTKVYQNDFEITTAVIFLPTYKDLFEEDHFENAIKITTTLIHQLVIQKTNTAFFTLSKNSIEIIPEIIDPEKAYEMLSLIKKININQIEFLKALLEFSQQLNYFYIIGTEQLSIYMEEISKVLPEGVDVNFILCSDELKDLPNLPTNCHCKRFSENELKLENITLA